MEDILLNSISLMIHSHPDLSEIPIYTDKANQDFKVPAFYVYNAYTKIKNGLRNKQMFNQNVRYSYFILYKNGVDEMFQQDAMNKMQILRKVFRYIHVEDPKTHEKYTFHVNDFDVTFNDVAMTITIRFNIPYRYISELEKVKELENIIIVKEEK